MPPEAAEALNTPVEQAWSAIVVDVGGEVAVTSVVEVVDDDDVVVVVGVGLLPQPKRTTPAPMKMSVFPITEGSDLAVRLRFVTSDSYQLRRLNRRAATTACGYSPRNRHTRSREI